MGKGQLFSLDFLVSLIAITVAIGLLLQISEVHAYNQKEQWQFNEVKSVAERAGNMLVSNSEMICDLTTNIGDAIMPLSNCLTMVDTATYPVPPWDTKEINKLGLGIPAGFDCYISVQDGGLTGSEQLVKADCLALPPADTKNVYSVSRDVVVYQGSTGNGNDNDVEKGELEACMQGDLSCKLVEGTVTIQVWKA